MHGMDAFPFPESKNNSSLKESIMKTKQHGVTLIELLITLCVIAIIAAYATPSLNAMVEKNRLTALNNQIVSALNYARGEAVKSRYDVTLCVRNSTGSDCNASGSFESGWIIFTDCDADGVVDTGNTCDLDGNGTNDAAENILQDAMPSANNIAIESNFSDTRHVTYTPNGNATDNGKLTLKVNGAAKYDITVAARTGRISSCQYGATYGGC